jgi:class 3 adenylate cyclase
LDVPETYYAKTPDDLSIAYQVFGDGPVDLLLSGGPQFGPVDLVWEEQSVSRLLMRLASFARVVNVDGRGTGASDAAIPTTEGFIEDDLGVLDAVGSERAVVIGVAEGGVGSLMFAASHPERTVSLVLVNAWARLMRDENYPWGYPPRLAEQLLQTAQEQWGTGAAADWSPSFAGAERFRRWFARRERLSLPRNIVATLWNDTLKRDLRSVLPTVRVPTLVIHRRDDPRIRIGHGRYLAEHIPGAKFVELDGADHHIYAGDQDAVLDEIEEFVTGTRPAPKADRTLATVMFTDIVSSTGHATRLGDRKWTQLLDQHDAVIARELERHRGRRVNPTGDGILATFDGPARAVRCAQAIIESVRPLGIDVRAGLHTGEVELRGDDIGGIAVHIGQRVSALARPGEVLVSRTVTDLVAGSGLEFVERGEHDLKGVPGKCVIYAVRS